MAKINRRVRDLDTNEAGTKVPKIGVEKQLRRVVLANMLFENQFYMDGESSADLIKTLVPKADPKSVQDLAIEARGKFKLRHVPLLLARELARIGKLPHEVLTNIIQRPDEMGEFVSHYWSEKKQPLSNQVKKGLANCFHKFSEYQLAKWNKSSAAIKLRDVLFMTHAKPKTAEETALFKRIAEDTLKTPDTWEVALSGGADKRETFERLMSEKKLGALAFLRNLRNMDQAGVPECLVRAYANELDVSRVLPFRFIAAANIVPHYEDMLESMMFKALQDMPKLPGRTAIVVDVSGSMFGTKISDKSDLDRFSAAAALAIMCKELCESTAIYSFSYDAVRVAPRRGFALGNAISASQQHGGTQLGKSLRTVFADSEYDRVIVFTDEQSYDRPVRPTGGAKGYIINVAAYKNGVNHTDWVSIDGFSEAVFDYICELEKE